MFKPKLLIIPILSLFLVIPESGAWENDTANWWLTYGGVYNKCLKLEGYSKSSAHYYCQCMAKCFADNMDDTIKQNNGKVEELVNKCGRNQCKQPLLQHIKATQAQ